MKTIMHKGKLLHHHAASGFYIDLTALREYVNKWHEEFDASKSDPDFGPTKSRSMMCLVNSRVYLAVESNDPYCPWEWAQPPETSLEESWRVVELHWKDSWFGTNSHIAYPRIGTRRMVDCKYLYPINTKDNLAMLNDWFPLCACYSPARIALENMP